MADGIDALLCWVQHRATQIAMLFVLFLFRALFDGSNSLRQGVTADPMFQVGFVGVVAFTVVLLTAGARTSSYAAFSLILLYFIVDMLYIIVRPISGLLEDLEYTYSNSDNLAAIWAVVGLILGLQSHFTSHHKFLALSGIEVFSLGTCVALLARTGDTRVMTMLPACIDLPLCSTVYGVVWVCEMLRERVRESEHGRSCSAVNDVSLNEAMHRKMPH